MRRSLERKCSFVQGYPGVSAGDVSFVCVLMIAESFAVVAEKIDPLGSWGSGMVAVQLSPVFFISIVWSSGIIWEI